MKRARFSGVIVVILIVVIAAGVLISSSRQQNTAVRKHFTALFTAVRDKDEAAVAEYYAPSTLPEAYVKQLFKYTLIGWEITKLDGQPWPLETMQDYKHLYATLYYDLPDALCKPKGPFESTTHPEFGKCGIVKVKLAYETSKTPADLEPTWSMPPPSMTDNENWIAPFEKPITGQ